MPTRRTRRERTKRWRRVVTWGLAAALVGWGVWQFFAVRGKLIAEAAARPQDDPPPSAATQPDDDVWDRAQVYVDPATGLSSGPTLQPAATAPAAPALTVDQVMARSRRVDMLVDAGEAALDNGDILAGRHDLNAALAVLSDGFRADPLRERLQRLNAPILMGPDLVPGDRYALLIAVAPGDNYDKLARRFHITPQLLAILNPQIDPRRLRPGAGLKVTVGPYHARVRRGAHQIDLYDRDLYVKTYNIVFDDGNFLPVGTYRVASGGKLRVAAGSGMHRWIELESVPCAGEYPAPAAELYGGTGPRWHDGRLSGVRLSDPDLQQVFAALTEQASYVRVDP